MKPPFDLTLEIPNEDAHTLTLRVLIAERPGGRLAGLITEFPIDIPIDFEVEDDLVTVSTLAAQNAFDIVVIGDSLLGRGAGQGVIASLVDATRITPVLILGSNVSEYWSGLETGSMRVVSPTRISPSILLREVRQTLEMHVLAHPEREQERRVRCLCRIFDSMIERMPYAVAVTDLRGHVCYLNRAARSFWADRGREALTRALIQHPEDGRSEILTIGPPESKVEVAPVPIEWLGEQYYLTSMRRVNGSHP